MAKKRKKNQKKNLKKVAKKAEKLLSRFKEKFPELIQNTTAKDWADIGVMGLITYVGIETFKDWRGGIFGLVSYKLATTPGGTPPIAQISGLAGLASMGLCAMAGERIEQAKKVISGEPVFPDSMVPYPDEEGRPTCLPGYKLMVSRFTGAVACVKL